MRLTFSGFAHGLVPAHYVAPLAGPARQDPQVRRHEVLIARVVEVLSPLKPVRVYLTAKQRNVMSNARTEKMNRQ